MNLLRCRLVTAVLLATAALAPALAAQRDSSASLKRAVAAEVRFLAQWDTAWRAANAAKSVSRTSGYGAGDINLPIYTIHCHPDFLGDQHAIVDGRIIQARDGWFAVCPSWDFGNFQPQVDERITIDEALRPAQRQDIQAKRAALLATLDSAAKADPRNDFIAGQRVRFAVDQRDFEHVVLVARECAATPWWCSALTGYAHAVRNDIAQADSAFRASFHAMPNGQRCAWNDQRALFAPARGKKYTSLSCAQRDSVSAWLWWLSTPLYIDTAGYHAREVEQYARRVLVALKTALPDDERYSWRDNDGGDARRTMLLRYGWPSHVTWGGDFEDGEHQAYLGKHNARPTASMPFTTYEYIAPRAHLVPAWSAVTDPFHAQPGDWMVSDGPAAQPATPRPQWWPGNVSRWWPVEHVALPQPLIQLPDGQRAVLRRQDSVIIAVATEMPAADQLRDRFDEAVNRIALVMSERPGSVVRLGEFRGTPGQTVVASAAIIPLPAIIGLEFAPQGFQVGGRLRFGITPPPPLSAMRAGELAVSNPILIVEPMSESEILPSAPATAIQRMVGTSLISKAGKVGVYWETYGFAPSDSIEVAVWIERFTPQGLARRFGIALHIATDLNTPVAISWQEPQTSGNHTVVPSGSVQIIGHSVVLDTSKLAPGSYWLDVAVRKQRGQPVRGRTSFVVK